MMTLGERIRQLRDAKDVSLREFAKQIEVTPAHLSDIELGRRFPSEQLLKRIAVQLGVRLEQLEKYDSRPPVDEIKRLSEADPAYGFAFRKIVDQARENKTTGEDFLKNLEKRKPDRKG
jgi:transcriptional regulator with XRE-family HTH domain